MRVGIDASAAAVPRPTGVGLAIAHQVAALRERSGLSLEVLYRLSRFKRRACFLPGGGSLFHPRWSLPLARRLDVFHGPDTRLPRFGRPALVATVHDLSARREAFCSASFRAKREAHWTEAAQRAALIVTYTAAVADEFSEAFAFPRERVAVVPLARVHGDAASAEERRAARARLKIREDEPYVLCLGERSARKNTANAVKAFAESGLPGRLVLVGPAGHGSEAVDEARERSGLGERVVVPDYLSGADVGALLAEATLLFFPTRYEGFGLPVLEAFAAETPVLASFDASVVEVAGGAAAHADAEDVPALAERLRELGSSAERRAELVVQGVARLKDYDWTRTAARLEAVYRAALARAPAPGPEVSCSR